VGPIGGLFLEKNRGLGGGGEGFRKKKDSEEYRCKWTDSCLIPNVTFNPLDNSTEKCLILLTQAKEKQLNL